MNASLDVCATLEAEFILAIYQVLVLALIDNKVVVYMRRSHDIIAHFMHYQCVIGYAIIIMCSHDQ